jgi:hypothetical protein
MNFWPKIGCFRASKAKTELNRRFEGYGDDKAEQFLATLALKTIKTSS